ncbi:hypothetical protein P8452_43927 [Trifolium repens]|nr:hypothetical protein P8452_43927 [Trifolium repens]
MKFNSTFLVCISLGLLFFNLANALNWDEPRRNANLSPFVGWHSAYICMLNHSSTCNLKTNYTITLNGFLNVQDSDINDFCKGGCYDHILLILKCIQDVKRDFYFANKAHISYVKNITMNGCNILQGFDTSKYKDPNGATSLFGGIYVPLISTLMTMALIATFGV